MSKDVVMIAKVKCLSCKHLFAENKNSYKCLEDKNCPAQTYKIVVGINVIETSDHLAEAINKGDTDTISQINDQLNKIDPEIKNKVFTLVKQKLKTL